MNILSIVSFMEINLLNSLFLFLTPLFLIFITKKYCTSIKNLPPGPRPLPIIGNIHQLGKNPHIATAMLAKQYGPLISLRLGSRLLVVASSPEAAKQILKEQDRHLSGRATPDAIVLNPNDHNVIWAYDCNQNWRSLRTLYRADLFSPRAIEAQSNIRNKKLAQMVDFLNTKQGKLVKIEDVVFTTMFNTLSNILFSTDLLDLNNEHETSHGLKWGIQKILENTMAPNVTDFFPVIGGLDLQGLRKENMKYLQLVSSFIDPIINQRRDRMASSKVTGVTEEKDFLDRMLEHNFPNAQINILILELFIAGTDSVTSSTIWAMADLIKNKEILEKVTEELKSEIKSNTMIMKFDLNKLSYFNACIKETLRLHPVVPLLLPRNAVETCEVMNYTIPQNSSIWINIWAISRDPSVWEDPNAFKPERFLGSNVNYTGHDFEFTPFGGGRRMCPGMPSGIKSLQTTLATLILGFDWVLPNNEDPAKLDMTETFGLTLQKEKPLELIFKRKE
uniref:probable (S)-N-methylcoclaurine 3'-hydroxylase isozyme 2 n=1 Tax=Erigeron canadensis TaxID=72917 RepID=UPI001CB96348|nr:probable (S)-N-methylcoclaurine 3'-hydroxylase isozyme 2 [Erigeron canadensis]